MRGGLFVAGRHFANFERWETGYEFVPRVRDGIHKRHGRECESRAGEFYLLGNPTKIPPGDVRNAA